jgi:hypothetical protein
VSQPSMIDPRPPRTVQRARCMRDVLLRAIGPLPIVRASPRPAWASVSERSAARLAHQSGGLGVPSSNLGAPTKKCLFHRCFSMFRLQRRKHALVCVVGASTTHPMAMVVAPHRPTVPVAMKKRRRWRWWGRPMKKRWWGQRRRQRLCRRACQAHHKESKCERYASHVNSPSKADASNRCVAQSSLHLRSGRAARLTWMARLRAGPRVQPP